MSDSAKNQNAILAVLGKYGAMSIGALDDVVGLERGEIVKAAGNMIVAGYVQRLQAGVYELTETGQSMWADGLFITSGPKGTATGQRSPNVKMSLRQRAWNVMRMGEAFDIETLAMVASDGTDGSPKSNLQHYCRVLLKAGYLIEMPTQRKGTRPGSNGHRRYKLNQNTGEIAPTHKQRSKPAFLFDHNTREAVPCR